MNTVTCTLMRVSINTDMNSPRNCIPWSSDDIAIVQLHAVSEDLHGKALKAPVLSLPFHNLLLIA